MTLTEAIEAAREGLDVGIGYIQSSWCSKNKCAHQETMEKALAALPQKPIPKADVISFITKEIDFARKAPLESSHYAEHIYSMLSDANVLYVEETPMSEPDVTI